MIHLATLYELQDTFMELLNLVQSGDIDEETFQDTIEALDLTTDIESKIESYVIVMDELKASSDRINNEIKRLRERKTTQDNNLRKLKETLLDHMKLTQTDKVKTDRYTVWTQNNPVRLVVDDESEIPKAYWEEQKPKLNTKLLKEDLQDDEYADFKGAHLEQSMGVRYR